jgi:acyl-CoA synthetase (AMP-forming)/AMP-acid ligase II
VSSAAYGAEPWLDVLARHAARDKPWILLPSAPVQSAEHRAVGWSEQFDLVRRIACALRERGAQPGRAVVVVADNRVETCLLLLGTLVAGAVIVPVAPLAAWQRAELWQRFLQDVCEDCEPALIVAAGRRQQPELTGIPTYDFAELSAARIGDLHGARDPAAVSLVQYTSGTTGRPRGVQLRHASIVHNIREAGRAFDARDADVGAFWLPLHHDMGLIGCLLFTTWWGMTSAMLTPRAFITRPESWLWTVARFGATCSAAPNAAYHACANKIADRKLAGLDLSRWRVTFNGSELIHPATLQQFARRFAGHGYRSNAMFPVYGLAENVVAATLPAHGAEPGVDWVDAEAIDRSNQATGVEEASAGARGIVCVGRSIAGQQLRIVEPETGAPLAERLIGEIQLRGPCTMVGYRGAEPQSGFSQDGWLRTGDRGYVAGGQLHVVGRYKHIIKRGGRLYDAAFIESLIRGLPRIRGGVVAAFGVDDSRQGTERLVVMAECAERSTEALASLREEIAHALREALVFAPDDVVLLPPGSIPRTTSGKVRHADARAIYVGA